MAETLIEKYGLEKHIGNWQQYHFEARMQVGAYSQSGESRRMR